MKELPVSALLEKGTPIEHAGVSYIIGDELGSGSFGVVYLAECDGKLVAIKKTKQTLDDDRTNQQFRNEGFCLQYSNHRAIPAFIATFQRAGYGYLVMEYIEGQDLDKYAESDAITEYEAVSIITSATDALQAMADRKPVVLHHDLKPDNIRISLTGTTHLLDFGSVGIGDQLLPTTKSIYSPPEQVEGEAVDQRAVIYALGATLFDLLTNQDPPEPVARRKRRDSQDIYDQLVLGRVSDGLAMLVARMMHPEKAQRYQTFAELRAALEVVSRILANAPQRVRAVPTQEIVRPRAPTDPLDPKPAPPPVPLIQLSWAPLIGLGLAATLIIVGLIMLFQALVSPPPSSPSSTPVVPTLALPTLAPPTLVPVIPTEPPMIEPMLPTIESVPPTPEPVVPPTPEPVEPPTPEPVEPPTPEPVVPTAVPPVFKTVITLQPGSPTPVPPTPVPPSPVPPTPVPPTPVPPSPVPPSPVPPSPVPPSPVPPSPVPPSPVPPTAAPPSPVPTDETVPN